MSTDFVRFFNHLCYTLHQKTGKDKFDVSVNQQLVRPTLYPPTQPDMGQNSWCHKFLLLRKVLYEGTIKMLVDKVVVENVIHYN